MMQLYTLESANATEVNRQSGLAQAFFEEVERGDRKGAHVVDPVRLAGLDRDRPLDPADDRDAGMAGRMAVAAAGRAGGAGLAARPGRVEPPLAPAPEDDRIGR